jgi:hypothetical protein
VGQTCVSTRVELRNCLVAEVVLGATFSPGGTSKSALASMLVSGSKLSSLEYPLSQPAILCGILLLALMADNNPSSFLVSLRRRPDC